MRARVAAGALALGALAWAAGGCGAKFDLPTESRGGRAIPTDKSYQMLATWSAMNGITDLLLTQGAGSQLFLLFNFGGIGTAPRGEVRAYPLTRPDPIGSIVFRELFNPVAIASGGDGAGGANNRIYVLDEGDSCLARTNPNSGTCDAAGGYNTRISDLSTYWRVREYRLLGGDTLTTFTDTTMAWVKGVASDASGNVYVSGLAIVNLPNTDDPRLVDREFQWRIYKYTRGPKIPGRLPNDKNLPGAAWHRDSTFVVEEGSGIGTVVDPHGLFWSAAGTASGLYAADFGKNWVQKLYDVGQSTGYWEIDGAQTSTPFNGPTDVAVDLQGYVYVVDTGGRRVLRYAGDASYVQRVDVELDAFGQPLRRPIAVAADDSLVYVADADANEVIRYKRRQ